MDEWEKKFREWKETREPSFFEKERTLGKKETRMERTLGEKKNTIGGKEDFFHRTENEIKIVEERALDYIREPKHIRIIKILIILTPLQRISEKFEDGENYRNLTQNLVYFNSPIVPGSKNVKVEVKFSDSFNEASIFYVGAKDKEVWHYDFKPIYNPSLSNNSDFIHYYGVYKTSDKLDNLKREQILEGTNFVIASDNKLLMKERKEVNFSREISTINTTLRGGHIFYTYLESEINLSVKKQDLNWYNGSD